jgi:hypothetical protein
MSDRMCCPDCGDLMCFHSGTVCLLKTHSDAFEKLKNENAKLKECLFQMQNANIDLVEKLDVAKEFIISVIDDLEFYNENRCCPIIDEIEIAKNVLKQIIEVK